MPNPSLPEELLDHIVDLLHDRRDALKNCCLVSKSWVPRTRSHLFACVLIHTSTTLHSWKKTFPDPSTSPAPYAKYLLIGCPQDVTAADAEAGGWIRTFSRVVHFRVDAMETSGSMISLAPFHGFSPITEILHVNFTAIPSSRIFNLILSFPHLKNVAVVTYDGLIDHAEVLDDRSLIPLQLHPLGPPAFTGCLELSMGTGIGPIASRLLSLQDCLHFRKLRLVLQKGNDISLATALVESCCATLESLYLKYPPIDGMLTGSTDLSKATKLKYVAFVSGLDPKRIASALRTVTTDHRDLHQISVYITDILRHMDSDPNSRETARSGWLELDSVFITIWESHSVRSKVRYYLPSSMDGERVRRFMEGLFPETTMRRVVDFSVGGHFWQTGGRYL